VPLTDNVDGKKQVRTCGPDLLCGDAGIEPVTWPSDALTSATGGAGSRRLVAPESSESDARSTAAVPVVCEEALARRCESRGEARQRDRRDRILRAAESLEYRAMLVLITATGLRRSE